MVASDRRTENLAYPFEHDLRSLLASFPADLFGMILEELSQPIVIDDADRNWFALVTILAPIDCGDVIEHSCCFLPVLGTAAIEKTRKRALIECVRDERL